MVRVHYSGVPEALRPVVAQRGREGSPEPPTPTPTSPPEGHFPTEASAAGPHSVRLSSLLKGDSRVPGRGPPGTR